MAIRETNTQGDTKRGALLAVERRRRVLAWVQRHGAANVAQLAQTLDVGPNTIRRDLAMLAKEGKLIRSHGGAVANDPAFTRLPYVQVRHEHAEQKEWIAEAALEFLPETGSVFLADGTTVQAFAMRIPPNASIHVVTNSVQIAARLTTETACTVELLGGRVRPELLATDCSLAIEALDMLFWDIAFVGAAALDVSYGITERDAPEAVRQRKFIDRATRVIALCDSSKLGRCSYARVGPLSLLDTIVTDIGASPEDVQAIRDTGVEVVLAGTEALQREVERQNEEIE
ncbi:MAG TPA: DeoR/GlpR family DNA-binding transcription regulator [Chthonomonadaceae bacterium]|nr:DeoR/GlpR family DNA-binding transcription regulator [Chthonomonadaceae bacterium]